MAGVLQVYESWKSHVHVDLPLAEPLRIQTREKLSAGFGRVLRKWKSHVGVDQSHPGYGRIYITRQRLRSIVNKSQAGWDGESCHLQ